MAQSNNKITIDLVLTVEGMTCNHCKMLVENNLKKTPGVDDAQVDLDHKKVRVTYDPSLTSKDQLANVIEQAGYNVKDA